MQSRKLRLGVVGAGNVTKLFHLPGWHDNPDVELVAITDTDADLARRVASEHGFAHVAADYRELVALDSIDAVDVCVPNRFHTPVVLAALAAGKHVLCEKPLAVTPAEIEQMIAARDRAGRMLMVAQNNRYRGISVAIKRWIEAGHLGDVYYARAWAIRRNWLPPMRGFICKEHSGGGPCMDVGVHCLDLAMWLMGFPEPVAVSGAAGCHLASGHNMPPAWGDWDRNCFDVEDFACGLVRFASGAALTLESSWLSHIPQNEEMSCTILGTKAGVTWPSGVVATASAGVLIDATLQPVPVRTPMHTAELWDFYEAVVNGRPSPVPAEESLKVIKILDGVYRSQETGREVRM